MKHATQQPFVRCGKVRILPVAAAGLSALLVGVDSWAQEAAEAGAGADRLEEVIVTGTRIRGAEGAVGSVVTVFGEDDFRESAEVTVSDLFKNAVPGVEVAPSQSASQVANWARNENINIHDLGTSRTLVLINGARMPMNGWSPNGYDPSVIPSISLERVDLLSAGASATYGSDAIAGVVNLVLRRGFEGARTQIFTGTSDGERLTKQVSQLFGTTWDTGGVTVGFEYYDREPFPASQADRLTFDFTPFGFADDTTLVNSAIPAIVSTGPPAALLRWGVGCLDNPPLPAPFNVNPGANCYSVPAGAGWNFGTQAPSATVDWATLLANKNVDNLFNPWEFADYVGPAQRTAFTMALDQQITDSVEAFADFYYSDRSQSLINSNQVNPLIGGAFTIPLLNPGDYPYTPTGAPPGLWVNYSTQAEINGWRNVADEEASRVAAGLNIEGPGEWSARVYYAYSVTKSDVQNNDAVNLNNVNAALGNVVFDGLGRFSPYVVSNDPNRVVTAADLARQSSPTVLNAYPAGTAVRVISPSSVPFLNVFCDARLYQCNDPRTLDFIRAHDRFDGEFEVHQAEATVSRALFEAPGGTAQVALGASFVDERFSVTRNVTYAPISTEFPEIHEDLRERDAWSVYGEMRLPIFSEQNARPGFRNLEFQLSARRDDYNDFGSTTNPRLGADWEPVEGLTIRGNRGRSFRAPAFSSLLSFVGGNIRVFGLSANGGGPNARFSLCTPPQIAQGSQPTPGTLAESVLNAIGAADCSDAAIMAQFAAVAADPNNPLYPSAATPGATAQTFLTNIRQPGFLALTGGVGDIAGRTAFHPPGFALGPEESESWSLGFDYAPPFADGLTFGVTYFNHKIDNLIGGGAVFGEWYNNPATRNQFTLRGDPGYDELLDFYLEHPLLPSTVNVPGVSGLWDLKAINIGTQEVEGADYNARYEWGRGPSTWHAGIVGTLYFHDILAAGPTVEDTFASSQGGLEGRPTAPRSRMRAQFGWRNAAGLSAILFMNYQSRYYLRTNAPVFGDIPGGKVPSHSTYDLTVGYNTGDGAARDIFRDVNVRLSMNNLTDEDPPFVYSSDCTGNTRCALDQGEFTQFGRVLSLSVTKAW